MKAKSFLQLLATGLVLAILGYALAYLLFSEALIKAFAGTGSGEWERSIIGDITMQVICGFPLPVIIGAALAVITTIIAERLIKITSAARFIFVGILGFIASFVIYFPWQIFMLIGSAF